MHYNRGVTTSELSLAVQAGGESRRMGQDKALLPFLGQPLVQYVLHRLAPLTQDVLVTTNHPQDLAFLNVRLVADVYPDSGALGGLFTALSAARGRLVAVVACDMPFASPALLREMCNQLVAGELDAVVPVWEDRWQPFHAVYRREVCLPWVQAALDSGRRRANAWFENVRLATLEPEDILKIDPSGLAFVNLNTPEEFQQAEALARKLENQ